MRVLKLWLTADAIVYVLADVMYRMQRHGCQLYQTVSAVVVAVQQMKMVTTSWHTMQHTSADIL